MTEQKQVFDKRELKALFRELLKPFAATIPEIGNQENAFNDAIPYLHRIFIGNNDYDWNIKELFYEFEDQIDDATNKAAEARRVFVLLLKVYILLEYINASYLFDNPFGPLCGKIDGLAAKVKQTCIENNVDVGFIDFMEKVYEEIDPTDCGFCHFVGSIISNLPDWDNSRFHLLTLPHNPAVEKEIEQHNSGKSPIPDSALMAEKDRRIKELEEQLAERDCKISELNERLAEMEVDWENAEDYGKETPKSVQMFFIKQLLDIVFKKETDLAKRDLVLLASLLFNFTSLKSVYHHPIPLKNDFVFVSKNEKEKIYDIAAVLIYGIGLDNNRFRDRVMEICEKIPTDEDYVKVVSRLLPTQKK